MEGRAPDQIAARREAARQRRRRSRRLVAGILLVVAAAVIGVAVASSGGSGKSKGGKGSVSHAAKGSLGAGNSSGHSARVRNARPQPDWVPHTGPVPILVYHALGTPPPTEAYPGLYVSKPEFRSQMAWLAQNGYQGVTIDEVMKAWYHGGTLARKPIVITFDNGYPEQATFAPAVLGKYGWPGVLNEITVGHLYASQIRPLIAKGWEIDSHSATHPDLTAISDSALRYEVAGSRGFLQRTFHVPANDFCYPSSRYDSRVIAAVKAAGYTGATTEVPGYASRDRPYELNRFEIEAGQGVSGLAADLSSH